MKLFIQSAAENDILRGEDEARHYSLSTARRAALRALCSSSVIHVTARHVRAGFVNIGLRHAISFCSPVFAVRNFGNAVVGQLCSRALVLKRRRAGLLTEPATRYDGGKANEFRDLD